MFQAVKRATLLYPSPSHNDPNKKHLFIILTDPCGPANQVLLASVSTVRGNNHDKSCILTSEDHEFCCDESFVAYAFCRTEPAAKLVKGVESNYFSDKGLIGEDAFKRIVDGLKKSKHTKPFALQFLTNAEA